MFRFEIGRWHAVARMFGSAAGFRSAASASCERTYALRGCGKYKDCLSFRTMGSSCIDVCCRRDPLAMRSVSWYGKVRGSRKKPGFGVRSLSCPNACLSLAPTSSPILAPTASREAHTIKRCAPSGIYRFIAVPPLELQLLVY